MKLRYLSAILILLALLVIPSVVMGDSKGPTIIYSTHCQNIGWTDDVTNGVTSGTTGQARNVEAYKVEGIFSSGSSLRYCAHVQDYGWLDWVDPGEVSGTVGENKPMEAFAIELTGNDAKTYDIYYRAHVREVGWLGWAKNGENSGSVGLAKPIEAIEITTTLKGSDAPGSTLRPFLTEDMDPIQNAAAHIGDVGWVETPLLNTIIGSTGKNQHLEAIQLQYLDNSNSYIEYTSHLADTGWEDSWHANGEVSGTTGQNRPMQAVKIRLRGEAANYYDIYYQAHSQNIGWLDWAKNGEPAGTTSASLNLEALNIVLVKKGDEAPGRTDEACRTPISAESFRSRIKGCWLDVERAEEPLKSYVTGIADSYIYIGQNSTYNGTEGYFEILTANTTGGRIRFVDVFTKQTKEAYIDFKNMDDNRIKIRVDGSPERDMVRGDTTDGIHYTFSGLMQYGQLAVMEIKNGP